MNRNLICTTANLALGLMLKGMKGIGLVIAVMLTVVIGVLVIQPSTWQPSASLRWGVDVGDEFAYRVVVIGHRVVQDPLNQSNVTYGPSFYAPMNNTVVRAAVADLPALAAWYSSSSFANEVISQTKVNCTFENGTPIQEEFRSVIAAIVSNCILPVGDWPFLDSLFSDSPTDAFFTGYLSRAHTNCFSISHRAWFVDGLFLWTGNVSLTVGMPMIAEDMTDTPSTGAYDLIRLVLL